MPRFRVYDNGEAYVPNPQMIKQLTYRIRKIPLRSAVLLTVETGASASEVLGLTWERPRYNVTRKLPFIPTEQEIDALILGTGRKLGAFLQLLKETTMRCGEAKRLQWTSIDCERNTVTLNDQEEGI